MNTEQKKTSIGKKGSPEEAIKKITQEGLMKYAEQNFPKGEERDAFLKSKEALLERGEEKLKGVLPYALAGSSPQERTKLLEAQGKAGEKRSLTPQQSKLTQQNQSSGFKPKSPEDLTSQVRKGLGKNKEFEKETTKRRAAQIPKGVQYNLTLSQRAKRGGMVVGGSVAGTIGTVATIAGLLS